MAIATRTLTLPNRSNRVGLGLSNFASRGQLNAEFCCDQLSRSDRLATVSPSCGRNAAWQYRERFFFAVPESYRGGVVPIRFPKKSRRNVVRQPSPDGAKVPRLRDSTRVRLRPRADWHKRNFLTSVLIPSLFVKRSGGPAAPQFPKIREGEICITWIGHASFLIQTHEVNILIDPIWSKWLKVIKRLKQPGFEIHHLPSIDFVLVTHAPFDLFDRRTLRRVAAHQTIVVPIGVGNLVHDLGFHIVHELDYWQTVELGPLKISLTPCHHWGARFLTDLHRDFGGFVIAANGRTIF